jgi:prevent-host-death family protein
MRTASITEAKNQLSALLDVVKAGETVVILDRGVPVARLEPAASAKDDDDGRIARLQRAGTMSSAPRTPLPPEFFDQPLPKMREGYSAVEALLQEREEGY